MRISKKFKPELLVSKDTARYNLTQPHLDVDAKRIVATNGHGLVSLPVACGDEDRSGPITVEALDRARKLAGRTDDAIVYADGSLRLTDGSVMPRPDVGRFAQYTQVIPSFKRGDEGTVTVSFDPAYLADLAKAIGAKHEPITITIRVNDRKPTDASLDPILITCADVPGAVGVLMPCRLDPPETSAKAKGKAKR